MKNNWSDYFKGKDLLRLLCRWRARVAAKRNPVQRLSDLVKTGSNPVVECPDNVHEFLPSRRHWIRVGSKERKRIGECRLLEMTIFRSALRMMDDKLADRQPWQDRLDALFDEVKNLRQSENVQLHEPTLHLVPKRAGGDERRCLASFDYPADRLLLSRTAAYLRDVFDPLMDDHSFAFRKDGAYNYKSAIEELVRYRRKYVGRRLYVAECDIQSFFDVINHKVVEDAYDGFVEQLDAAFRPDQQVRNVLLGYLNCFTSRGNLASTTEPKIVNFRHLVKPLEATDVGRFYPDEDLKNVRLGIPQGGALSPLIANIVLHSADRAVRTGADPELLYLRFCDDIIIVHPDRNKCKEALCRYMGALEMLKLPIHPLKRRVVYDKNYYTAKSKGPFIWSDSDSKVKSTIPWVAFLGVHVRYDGVVRVREDSVEKHKVTLKRELKKYKEIVGRCGCNLKDASPSAKESLLRSFEARIVAMGVGYSTERKPDVGCRCWVAAFPSITPDAPAKHQLRQLDRTRGHLVAAFKKYLGFAPGRLPSGAYGYYGRPFSYYGVLADVEKHKSYPSNPCSYGEW